MIPGEEGGPGELHRRHAEGGMIAAIFGGPSRFAGKRRQTVAVAEVEGHEGSADADPTAIRRLSMVSGENAVLPCAALHEVTAIPPEKAEQLDEAHRLLCRVALEEPSEGALVVGVFGV